MQHTGINANLTPELIDKLARVRLLVCDIDGIMSDGKVIFDSAGLESKQFFTPDGMGISRLQKEGIKVGIITGRKSPMVDIRARELGICLVIQDAPDKLTHLKQMAHKAGISLSECAYIGDDLVDVAAILAAGVGFAPSDGEFLVKRASDIITQRAGGAGCVREACERILDAKGCLVDMYRDYLGEYQDALPDLLGQGA